MLSESLTKTKLKDPLILELLQNIRGHRYTLENLKSIKVNPDNDSPTIVDINDQIINEGEIVANGTNDELMTSFMRNVLLTMEVKAAKVDSIKHIQATLPNVKFISTSKEKSIHTIQLEYEKNKDSREEIFNYIENSNSLNKIIMFPLI